MLIISNLNTYSYYSLLSSTLSIDEIISFAIKNNQKYVALTDTNMYGAIEFINKAKENKLLPVLGLNILYKEFELIIFAKNENGYKNLIRITSHIGLNEEFDINNYLDGTFIINKSNNLPIFLKTDFYNINSKLPNNIACNEARYLNKEDNIALTSLLNISNNKTIENIEELDLNQNLFLKTSEELEKFFSVESINNLNKEISEVNLQITYISNNIPVFKNSKNLPSFEYLLSLVKNNLDEKIFQKEIDVNLKQKYIERYEYELSVINKMGFSDYFLIVQDFVNEAKNRDILVGPGRGSAAGSLVAFLLGIIDVDPIKYNLFFERFLNSDRVSMPDIDIDIMDTKREEIIDYIFDKYGYDHVAHIITFQRIKSKMALRDIGRMLKIDLKIINKICKLIPMEFDSDLDGATKAIKELKDYESSFEILFKISKKVLDNPRQVGIHAAGIILSKTPMLDVIPLQYGANNDIITQYSMEYIEQLKILKMDILGLTNLTIITNILKLIDILHHIKIDLKKINLNDSKVFFELAKGNTLGIFQLESPGMRNLVRKINPKSIEDISICSSLFRPGPQQNINNFLLRKNGEQEIENIDDRLVDILQPTFGIIVYQEQVIEIVRKVANFSAVQADSFRRIISKKISSELDSFKTKFFESSLKNGFNMEQVEKIYHYIFTFANYGFNHSHSLSYSLISYWMSFLKTYYPLEFMITLMTSCEGNNAKLQLYLDECKRLKINILKSNINLSLRNLSLYKKQILFGLNNLKGIGDETSKKIINIREQQKNKIFESYLNAVSFLSNNNIGKSVIENLIFSGCFDCFNLDRKYMIDNLDEIISCAKNIKADGTFLFEPKLIETKLESKEDFDFYKNKEYELVGLEFPVKQENSIVIKEDFITSLKTTTKFIDIETLKSFQDGNFDVLFKYEKVRIVKMKKGTDMAFITIIDNSGKAELVCFNSAFFLNGAIDYNKIYLATIKTSVRGLQLIYVKKVF